MRSVILISLNFPPSTIASVHRARHLAKHLPSYGWRPLILTVDERYHKEPPDRGLSALVPESVEIIRTGAIPVSVTRWLGLGDLSIRSIGQIKSAVERIAASKRPDVIFITGWPFYQMLLSRWIQTRLGLPVVLDFQDPWVSAWGAAQRRWSKAGLAHRLATILEPKAICAANFITSVSETQNADMRARYPWLDAGRMAAIPIGGDPADYHALGSYYVSGDRAVTWPSGQRTLAFVGTFMPRTAPVMEELLKAFSMARVQNPGAMDNVRLLFVGTSNQANDTHTFRVLPLARAIGLNSGVEEISQRVPFLDAISILARSDGILLIGSDEPHYTASKIYPGLMAGRPYLSVYHRASSAHAILSKAGGGIALAFGTPGELEALPPKIAEALITLATKPESVGQVDHAAYADYTAHAVAGRFAAIFDRLREERRSGAGRSVVA
jgi:hypothetical protein